MSGFSYKGIDIYTITNGSKTTGSAIPGCNFNGIRPAYNGLIPDDFGFSYQETSVSNLCTALNEIVYSPGSIVVPTGSKSVSIIARGGAGGAGGGGGYAQINGEIKCNGGSRGNGGNGAIVEVDKINLTPGISINYVIGTSGNTNHGNQLDGNGDSGSTNGLNYAGKYTANAGNGGNGNGGNATDVYIEGSTYTAPGGNGGGGGNGGSTNNKKNGNSGNNGSTPNPSPNNNNQLNYPSNANSSIQFIWFYQ